MAARYIKNTAILQKIETTSGTDAVPTGAANALLVSNLTINSLNAQNVSRDLIRNYFGGSEQLVGTSFVELGYDIEISGSGAAGTAPAWGVPLRCCGFAEAITAGNRVEYTPISSAFESSTIYWYDDGVLHKGLYARGDVSLKMGLGDRPVFSFKFTCLDGGVSAAALPSTTLTAFKTPLAITDANTGDINLGCTYSAGSLSSGTPYPSRGLELSVGNAVSHMPLLGGESVDITGREITGSMQLDLTAAQEVTNHSAVKANTVQSLGFIHGTTAGGILVFHAPAMQMINPSKQELNGKRLIGYDLRLLPSSGNDELRIVAK